MKITDFRKLIQEIPHNNHSFDIKKSNWKCDNQSRIIDQIFEGKDIVTLNRYDLINSKWNIEEFIIKTLMWGYPTKGRGNNINTLLMEDNFKKLIYKLEHYKNTEISIGTLKKDMDEIPRLGLSTITKFTHFLNTRIEGFRALILDARIIEVINSGRFEELNSLKGININNALRKYVDYIRIIDMISKDTNSHPDQVEMFLFTLGKNLSEIQGEEYYGDITDM